MTTPKENELKTLVSVIDRCINEFESQSIRSFEELVESLSGDGNHRDCSDISEELRNDAIVTIRKKIKDLEAVISNLLELKRQMTFLVDDLNLKNI